MNVECARDCMFVRKKKGCLHLMSASPLRGFISPATNRLDRCRQIDMSVHLAKPGSLFTRRCLPACLSTPVHDRRNDARERAHTSQPVGLAWLKDRKHTIENHYYASQSGRAASPLPPP